MPFRDDRSFRIERLEAELATAIAERDAARADRDAARAEVERLCGGDEDLMRRYLARSAEPTESTPLGLQIFLVLFGLALVVIVIGKVVHAFSTPVVQH